MATDDVGRDLTIAYTKAWHDYSSWMAKNEVHGAVGSWPTPADGADGERLLAALERAQAAYFRHVRRE